MPAGPRTALFVLIVAAAPTLFADIRDDIAVGLATGRSFSELYASARAGDFDPVLGGPAIRSVYAHHGTLHPREQDALAEFFLLRAKSAGDEVVRGSTEELLRVYGEITDPGLRSEVLLSAHRFALPGAEQALHRSAAIVAESLRASTGVMHGTIENEALVVASLAPEYPTVAVAENLRTIAKYSRDVRVTGAARASAREVLRALPE